MHILLDQRLQVVPTQTNAECRSTLHQLQLLCQHISRRYRGHQSEACFELYETIVETGVFLMQVLILMKTRLMP